MVEVKEETEHRFKKIKKRLVLMLLRLHSFVENRRLKNITGVKTKEPPFWVSVSDISVKDDESNKITFAIPSGIKRSYPASAFELEEEEEKKEDVNKEEEEENVSV